MNKSELVKCQASSQIEEVAKKCYQNFTHAENFTSSNIAKGKHSFSIHLRSIIVQSYKKSWAKQQQCLLY